MDKFIAFLEALKNEENATLIENVIAGYKAVHEVIEPITGEEVPLQELEADLKQQIAVSTDMEELKNLASGLVDELKKTQGGGSEPVSPDLSPSPVENY